MPTRSEIDILLMDAFCVRRGGCPIRVPHNTARLLALLAVRGRPLARSAVAATLWPDQATREAATTLRTALWRGSKCIGAGIVTGHEQLALSPEVAVDLHRLRMSATMLQSGQPSGANPGPSTCPSTCSPDVFVGELLPGWDDEWLTGERERTRQLAVHALETMCRALTERSRFAEAIDAGVAAVTADPLRESAHRVLIEAHLAEGNVSEATRQYDRYRSSLLAEMGLEPSPAITRLMGHPPLALIS